MMDHNSLGDNLGGLGHKHSNEESPFAALTSDGHGHTAFQTTHGLNQLGFNHEDANVDAVDSETKKKKVAKIIGGGLRQFSVIVCNKLESKGSTTYSEVADEIIAEFAATQSNAPASLDEFNDKNIRRRVYDALNVLMALDVITRDKKEIRWNGLPGTCMKDLEELKEIRGKLKNRIGKKAAYLKDLEEQVAGLQNLMSRNQQSHKNVNAPLEGFSLPFMLVQTSPHATVEVEISEDMQLVHFDFNSTPFSLHDDAYILKLMQHYHLPESRQISQSSSVRSSSSSGIASGGTKPFYWNSETDTPS